MFDSDLASRGTVSFVQHSVLRRKLVPLAVAAAVCGAMPAQAQDARADGLQEVVVTGSRIIREGMSTPTPVTALSTEELMLNSPQSISQAMAQLPSMTSSVTPRSIGGRSTAGPGSFLSLRNLGSSRNLVLLDGRRVVPSNIAGNTDINLLPQGLISNVEVVTGGASAAYGSDAVAGVSNFVLNKRFEGVKIDLNMGESAHRGDAESYRTSLVWGAPFMDGRLHLIGSFDWRNSEPGYSEYRNWSNRHCAVVPIPGVNANNMSPDNPRQTIACGVTQPNASYGGAIISGPLVTPSQGITFGEGGVPLPFNYGQLRSGSLQVGGDGNYIGDVQNFSTPTDNKVFFGRATFDVSDNVEAFAQLTVGRADSEYAQTIPYFINATPLVIHSGNPFIPAAIQDRMTALNVNTFNMGIVPKSWGNIDLVSTYRTWDAVVGLEGDFGDSWKWNMHYEHGRTSFLLDFRNQISFTRLYRALDAVRAPSGAIVCQSALVNPAAYGDCVPLNPFGPGSASQAALDYIHGEAQPWNEHVMRQQSAGLGISGEPFSSWAGAISVAAGVEWRKLEGKILSDRVSHTMADASGIRGYPSSLVGRPGDWSTNNTIPTEGEYDVTEGYLEAFVPLARDITALRELDLNAAFRITDYSQSGTVETWKAGLTWRPIDEVLVRLTRSRDIRAPNISDLYMNDSIGPNIIVNDTITGTGSITIPFAQAGNPDLQPEKADTTTFGVTYQPGWLPGFGMSVDYFDIQIKDVLSTVSGQETVNRCERGEVQYCANLIRDSNTGLLTLVRQPTMNLSEARTKGVDLDLSYRTTMFGAVTNFRVIGTRLLEQSTTVPTTAGVNYTDRVGDISLGYAKWVVNATASVDLGAAGFNVGARYIHGGPYNTTYRPGDIDPRFAEVGSNVTVDLGGRYRLENMFGEPELYFHIGNVFDRDPPLIPSSALVGFQTSSSLYDTIGRYYTVGVRMAF